MDFVGDIINGICGIFTNESNNRAKVRMNDSDNIAKVAGGAIAATLIGYGIHKVTESNNHKNSTPSLNSGK